MLIQEHLKIHIILDQRPTIIFIYFTVYSNANCLQKLIQAKELNNYDSYYNHCNFKSGVI